MSDRPTLPLFPETAPLCLDTLDVAREMVALHEPYSDFDPGSLWAWDDGNTLVSRHCDNLVVRFPGYEPGDPVQWSFLGEDDPVSTAQAVLDRTGEDGLVHIPAPAAAAASAGGFKVEEEVDHTDYVVELEEYLAAAGRPYAQVRIARRRFYACDLTVLEPVADIDEDLLDSLDTIDEAWAAERPHAVEASAREQHARRRLTAGAGRFDLVIHIARTAAGTPVGYTIAAPSASGPEWALWHFGKAIDPVANAGLWEQQAAYLHTKGVRYLNLEQDLGFEGLRRSKRAQSPSLRLRKYTVSRA